MGNRNKIIILGVSVGAILLIVLGITYALYSTTITGETSELVAGDIYMHYKEGSKTINIENAIPSNTYDENTYFEFSIVGKNTHSEDIWYEIVLKYGEEHGTRTERLADQYLKFRLTKVTNPNTEGESEEEVVKEMRYYQLDGKKLWVDTVPAETEEETTTTYRLYMWVSDEVKLGNVLSEEVNYTVDNWNNNIYASVKVSVNGDFNKKVQDLKYVPATETIKNTLGDESGKGIIAVTKTNQKVDKQEELQTQLAINNIREYRYSGAEVDNYIYFNCENGATAEDASEKCEKWRIIGVFTDEDTGEERVKIVRNAVLPLNIFPENYLAENGTTYKIKYVSSSSSNDYAYWNYDGSNYSNDWARGGLQYWLNSKGTDKNDVGYLNKLSTDAQNLIADTKYYFGNVTYYGGGVNGGSSSGYGIKDTANEAYANERNNKKCSSSETNGCQGGYIWPNNSDTWTGKIALMYPSDYGYSASSDYWNTKLGLGTFNGTASETSWLQTSANQNSN